MLQLGNKEYSLAYLNVKQSIDLPTANKQDTTFHTSVIYKNSLYLYAWPDTCSVLKLQKHTEKNQRYESPYLLKLDKGSSENFNLSDYSFCYASAILNNQLHFLVSKTQSKPESLQAPSMIKLNLTTGVYSQVHTSGQPPSFRIAPLVEPISNMYFLVYSGMDSKNKSPFSDAYALIFWEWHKLKISNPIEPRIYFTSTILNNKIYLHGGQLTKNDQKTYFSDMYELTFSDTKKQLIFQKIHYDMGSLPNPRSNHKMTSISSRYLMIFDGISQNKNNQGLQSTITLKDFWMFDLLQRKWFQIQNEMQKYNFYYMHSSSSHLNQLFIFGAFQNVKNNKTADLIKLQFPEKVDKKIDSSSIHQMIIQKSKENLEGTNIEFATSLIHNSSYLIKFPFQSIQRIIQFAQNQNAQTIRIYSEVTTNTIDKYLYISIDIKSTENFQSSNDLEFKVQKLFIYCLRIGKTVIYVQNHKKTGQRKVYLMSADGRFTPLLERLQLYYSYVECTNSEGILSVQNPRNKQIIQTIVQGLIENPQSLIRSIEGGKIMIFTPNIITTPKSYYYELVFDSLHDISLFKNNKKLELLDRVKYDLGNLMEFSLHSYLMYSNTNKTQNKNRAQIYLSKSSNPVPQGKLYADYLEEFSKQGKIIKVNFSTDSHVKHVDSYSLYACQQDFYLPENNGILLYQNGHLVNRYECQFGKLLQDKFFKKKIKSQAKNIFIFTGQIHLSKRLGLINFNTEFQKTNKFIEFKLSLQTLLADFLQKMQPAYGITKMCSKQPKNTSKQSQNVFIEIRENKELQSKQNQLAQINAQDKLLQQDKPQEEQIQEQNSHKRLKLDDQVQQIQENQ